MPSHGDRVGQHVEAEQGAGGRGREQPGRKYAGFFCFPPMQPPPPLPPYPRTGLQICSEAGRSGLLAWHPHGTSWEIQEEDGVGKAGSKWKRGPSGHRAFAVVTQRLVPGSDSRAVIDQRQGSHPSLPRTPREATAVVEVPLPHARHSARQSGADLWVTGTLAFSLKADGGVRSSRAGVGACVPSWLRGLLP